MTFDKRADELVRTILRSVRGCATDSQYSDAYDRAIAALTTVRKEARETAFKDAVATVCGMPNIPRHAVYKADVIRSLKALANSEEGEMNG